MVKAELKEDRFNKELERADFQLTDDKVRLDSQPSDCWTLTMNPSSIVSFLS